VKRNVAVPADSMTWTASLEDRSYWGYGAILWRRFPSPARTKAKPATGLLPRGTAQGDTGRYRTTKPRAETRTGRHCTAQDDTGRQMVYQICTQGVAGSNPAVSTTQNPHQMEHLAILGGASLTRFTSSSARPCETPTTKRRSSGTMRSQPFDDARTRPRANRTFSSNGFWTRRSPPRSRLTSLQVGVFRQRGHSLPRPEREARPRKTTKKGRTESDAGQQGSCPPHT